MQATIRVRRAGRVIRATIPIDPPIPWTASSCPFELVTEAGEVLETQWEPVAFAPGATPGDASLVRVAELLAIAPNQSAGPATYTVHREDRPTREQTATPASWARRLLQPGGLELVVDGERVPFSIGARYRSGPVAVTVAIHAPHAFGWLTVYEGLDVAWLDLVVHNAEPKSREWYFDELGLAASVPPLHFEPASRERDVGSAQAGQLALVRARADGALHALEQRGWRVFQGVLHDGAPSSKVLAQQLVGEDGWGVASTWTAVDAYQPHALRIPNLHYRLGELATKCRADWAAIDGALANGTAFGMGVKGAGRLDWRHPWGPEYGGVTGGGDRFQWSAVHVLACGEPEGLRELRARLRMIADRSAVAIVKHTGRPIVLEDWLTAAGAPMGNWRMSAADANFHVDGAFGWTAAAPIVPAGRTVCPEHAALRKFAPIDFQHADRATKAAESLVWLTNCPIARWWVTMSAELWRMSEFTYDGKPNASAPSSQLGHGTGVGRADGHGWCNAAAAFAISRQAWRERWAPWFARFARRMVDGQMPNGLFQFLPVTSKACKDAPFGNGQLASWCTAKGTEEALLAGALFAIARSVALPEGLAAASIAAVDRWSIDGVYRYLGQGASSSSFSAYVAVRPVTWSTNPKGQLVANIGAPVNDPAAALRAGSDSSELLSPVGCAMLERVRTGRSIAVEQVRVASKVFGMQLADPLVQMRTVTLHKLNLDDCSPAHAALALPN